MSNPIVDIAAGTALGLGGVVGLETIAKHFPQLQDLLDQVLDPSFKQLMHIEKVLYDIKTLLESDRETSQVVVLCKATNGPEQRIFDYKKAHFLIFTPVSFGLQCNVAALGMYNVTLLAGWNLIDLPQDTTLVINPTDPIAQQAVLFRESNNSWGNPI